MPLYLIHFDRPVGTAKQKAQHYLGHADDVDARVADHLATTWERFEEPAQLSDGRRDLGCAHGAGANLLGAVNAAGIARKVVRVWKKGNKVEERRLKNHHHGPRLCPICNPAHWETRGRKPKGKVAA